MAHERETARWRRVWLGAILVVALGVAPAAAQTPTGSIQGTAVDQSGGVLPGVTVTISNTATGAGRTVVTDELGLFRALLLPVGPYEVTAELQGFATLKQSVPLTVGQTVTLRLQMTVATVQEAVTVTAESPVIETSRTQVSATVNEVAVANLPVNGRNFIEFVLLTPGVTRDVRTGDISFAGQRGTLNSLVVDGADNNNTFFGQTLGRTGSGRAPYQFSQDAVKEFQVNSNAYSAEFGRAGGAVINVVTKSGTNTFSGAVFEFFRDKSLNANDAINVRNNRPKGAYHYNQFGGNVGGPLQRDRHFFFFDYDGQRNTSPNTVVPGIAPERVPADADSQAGFQRLAAKAGSWSQRQDQDVFFIKTDHQLSDAHRLSLRYNHQDFTGRGFERSGIRNALEHSGDSLVRTRTFNVNFASVIGSSLFNEVRFQYARDREPGSANSPDPEADIRQFGQQVLVIGRNFFSPRETTIDRWQVADAITYVRGAHKIKAGFDFQFDDIFNFFPGNFSGSYRFNTLASFNRGRPDGSGEFYVQAFPGPGTTGPETHPDIEEYSFFAQDEWRVAQDVTLNLGLRYDVQKFAKPPVQNRDPQLAAAGIDTSTLNTDTSNWGPRVGLAWSPAGGKYVVRLGYGLFFGRTPSIMVGTAHSNNGINVQTITFTGALVPTHPNTFSSIPAGAALPRPTIFIFDRDYENARVQQASAGFEYEILPNTAVAVSYLFVKGDDLPRSTDINIGPASPVTFTVAGTGEQVRHYQFARGPFASFDRIISFQSTAESQYHGVTFELNRRFAQNFQARAAYTLGRVEDTVPDATAVVPGTFDDAKFASNPADFETDRADGNNDQRHRFVFSGIFATDGLAEGLKGFARAFVRGWTFSAIFTAQSGQPYSPYVSADANRDGNRNNDIAPGTARNEFRLPAQVSLDPRIARDVPLGGRAKLRLIFEGFNFLNRANYSAVNTVLYTLAGTTLTRVANFGQETATSGPRIMQLAVKMLF